MDDDKRYNVVLTGRLRPRHRREEVVAAIARLYRVDPARIERTFARAPRVIKPAVSRRKATKYLLALGRAGAEVVIEPVASAALPISASGARAVSVGRAVGDPGATGSPSIAADPVAGPEPEPEPKSDPLSAPESASGSSQAAVTPVLPPGATNPAPNLPSAETNPHSPEIALLSEPDSLPLNDGRGGGRTRLLVVLVGAFAVVLGIGAGGWYLRGGTPPPSTGEPAAQLPVPTVVAVSAERATSPDADADADAGPGPDPVVSAAPDEPAPGRSGERADGQKAPADSFATLADPVAGLAASTTRAGAPATVGVSLEDGLSALDLAAPFGLRMGASIEQLPGAAERIDAAGYRLATVREPLAAFTDYGVRIGPDSGLCVVRATGVVARTAADGVALRAAFDAMESALTSRLGPAARTDVLLAASPLTAPDAWMQALERQQRYLFSVWSGLSGARLPADVRRVTLRAGANSEDAGRVTLEIAFRNEATCDETAGEAFAGAPSFSTPTTPNPSQHSSDE